MLSAQERSSDLIFSSNIFKYLLHFFFISQMSQHKSTYSLVMAEVNITGRYFMWYGGEGVLQYYTHSNVFVWSPSRVISMQLSRQPINTSHQNWATEQHFCVFA